MCAVGLDQLGTPGLAGEAEGTVMMGLYLQGMRDTRTRERELQVFTQIDLPKQLREGLDLTAGLSQD